VSDPHINRRKLEHIEIIENDPGTDRRGAWFDRIRLAHRALPQIDLDAIDPSITLLGRHLSFPLLISSMTGGDHAVVRDINRNLAIAAAKTGVALAVGSQRVMFQHPSARESFALRELAPDTLLFANLGAVQLNKGFGLDHAREAVEVVGADALYLHLNPLQEAIQPEGDTCFAGLDTRIADVRRELSCEIVLKEVGCGLSVADAELAQSMGVRYLDVAGSGGTSWSRIEARRDATRGEELGLLFQDWGIPTPLCLHQLSRFRPYMTLFASGGVRSGLDMAKAVVLGASLCGLAAPFLAPARESPEAVIVVIEKLRREFLTAMFLLGAANFDALHDTLSHVVEVPW